MFLQTQPQQHKGYNEIDTQFLDRIQNTIFTVQAWDADPLLLAECRLLIPFDELGKPDGKYSEPQDRTLSSNTARFVQRLARFFRQSMTWINEPTCTNCGSTEPKTSLGGRGPSTVEEREGQASRVEQYECRQCKSRIVFPRYNSVRKLLETRQGRCGEYANLFGLVCRASGFETRYILDVTDHVWTEVYVADYNNGTDCNWIMVDSCEGVIDENSMYEAGWGKNLSTIIAVSVDHVVDVTSRYTRKWNNTDFQLRRRSCTSSEDSLRKIIEQCNQSLRIGLEKKTCTQLDRRLALEQVLFQQYKTMTVWDKEYANGRISGSLAWKVSRNETGICKENLGNNQSISSTSFYVESFFAWDPSNGKKLSIRIKPKPATRHDAIVISGVSCAMGIPNCASVVVLDEVYLGCILQSRCVSTLSELSNFISTLPKNRIVAIHGEFSNADENNTPKEELTAIRELGGFDCKLALQSKGFVYIGQVLAHPKWTVCCSITDLPDHGILIESANTIESIKLNDLKLRTERGVRPSSVIRRLDESVMPLQTQLVAGYEQKRDAFLSMFAKDLPIHDYVGYTTKRGAPVYLLGSSSYPFNNCTVHQEDANNTWNSFLLLPAPLIDPSDDGIKDSIDQERGLPTFEIPIEDNFFVTHLGSELYQGTMKVHTLDAIRNTRLVGLYFSAHWCGPCRSFTPTLAEMYSFLKDEHPIHGLEIVFVSSDRDENSFLRYYGSMPWLAIPFEKLILCKAGLSSKYAMKGIPALIILDSMSGEIVASVTQSRQEVVTACNQGKSMISNLFKTWIDRVPESTREMIEMLSISCKQDLSESKTIPAPPSMEYFIRQETVEKNVRMESLVKQLLDEGLDEADAIETARAVENLSSEVSVVQDLPPGALNEVLKTAMPLTETDESERIASQIVSEFGHENLSTVLTTLIKYCENVKTTPWISKYRSFNLSFKVADRIASVKGGIPLIQSLGIDVFGTADDFVASIPFNCNVDVLKRKIMALMET